MIFGHFDMLVAFWTLPEPSKEVVAKKIIIRYTTTS